ncbi:MAG: N-acetylmuramoyl-L-alanine amidase [Lachnospiraceae bacterium]
MREIKNKIEQYGEKFVFAAMAVMFVMAAFLAVKGAVRMTAGGNVEEDERKCVVIDAGHGGADPGKIGINGAKEMDINLQIAIKVKRLLEQQDIKVIMTRETEAALYEGSGNQKVQDMKCRIELIEEEKPDITVSIHQNSYPEEYVKGAQVFYYKDSADSRDAAEIMQRSLVKRLDPENHREAKANGSYYLLKKTSTPIIIVECGFLSNSGEAELLASEEYQEKVAWAIHMGILQKLNHVIQ